MNFTQRMFRPWTLLVIGAACTAIGCSEGPASPTPGSSSTSSSASSSGSSTNSTGGSGPPAPGLPWIRTEGIEFANETVPSIRLTGIGLTNAAWGQWVSGTSEALQAMGKDPLVRPTEVYPWVLTDADFDVLSKLPIKVVRYDINYELFAPDNPKLASNLSFLRKNAQRFGQLGIYVIVDLSMPIGLDVQSDNAAEQTKPGAEREKSLFESSDYFDATVDMWKRVATELKDLPEVAGYELVNEPRLPSDADGGLAGYQAHYEALCAAIRSVDDRHILFVPEYNSREANPGESYWDAKKQQFVVDTGEQGIIWDHGMVKVSAANVAYVFHVYDPYEYTSAGAATFDPMIITQALATRVSFRDTVGHAPLFVSEYGVNRQQTPEKRAAWLDAAHDAFRQNGVSATLFTYKAPVDAYVSARTIFALYGQFVTHDQQVTGTGDAETLVPSVQSAATTNQFDILFDTYFRGKSASYLSPMDSAPLLDSFSKFDQ